METLQLLWLSSLKILHSREYAAMRSENISMAGILARVHTCQILVRTGMCRGPSSPGRLWGWLNWLVSSSLVHDCSLTVSMTKERSLAVTFRAPHFVVSVNVLHVQTGSAPGPNGVVLKVEIDAFLIQLAVWVFFVSHFHPFVQNLQITRNCFPIPDCPALVNTEPKALPH